jgi:betaine-aldehyde dehydrogenase
VVAGARIALIRVVDPATEETVAEVEAATVADLDAAVAAARAAQPAWAARPPAERAAVLRALADGLEGDRERLARIVTSEVGTPIAESRELQLGMPLHNLHAYADLAERYAFEGERVGNSLIVREPVGVVGAITPWNFPLHQIVLKVAPALAAGCAVVLKPSELTPLDALAFAELAWAAGLPRGVLGVVAGTGPTVGEALAAHPDVDMVSFTGSTRAGTRVAELAAPTVKKVALELGGKSANLVLAGADLPAAVAEGVAQCFLNAGQNCAALSRLLVPRDRLAEAEEVAVETARGFVPGDPLDEATRLGPLVSAAQLERVRTLIDAGVAEGARLLQGGPEPVRDRGWFVAPTVFSGVDRGHRIAREEIFGPVVSLLPYVDEEEAVAIAEDGDYGLFASVWAGDDEHALAVARRLRAGQVRVNGGAFNLDAPFGGRKRSGIGREAGVWGLEEVLEVKAIHT